MLTQTPVQTPTSKYAPRISGPLPGPKARAIVEADDRWMSPSYTRSYPLVAKRGRGSRVEDVDGNEFLDFAAGIAVVSTGHCHPEVVKAIQQQAGELIHMSGTDFYYEGLRHTGRAAFRRGAHARAAPFLLRQLRRRSGRVRAEGGPLSHRTAKRDRLPGRLPRAHHGGALAHRVQAAAEAALRPAGPGCHTCALSLRLPRLPRRHRAGAGGLRTGMRPLHRETASSRPCCRRKRWPPSSWNRSRARVVMWSHRPSSCRSCGRSATDTAFCWWPMRCSPARDAPASGGRLSILACSPTSSAWPRASPPACRSVSA